MLVSLAAVLTLAVQDPPPAPPAPPQHRVMIRTVDGPGLDKDGDGFVSRDEFSAPMTDHFGQMDKDGDGRLSTAEMGAGAGGPGEHEVMIRRVAPGAPGEHGRHIVVLGGPGEHGLSTFTSRDGGETRIEAHTIVMHGPAMPLSPRVAHAPGAPHPGGADVVIRRIGGPGGALIEGPRDQDKDGDGRVSEAEFLAPLREAFAKMDADGSGALEEGERGRGDVHVFSHRVESPSAAD